MAEKKDVDARDKRGHDGGEVVRSHRSTLQFACKAAFGRLWPKAAVIGIRPVRQLSGDKPLPTLLKQHGRI
jgi:hypothetical protein